MCEDIMSEVWQWQRLVVVVDCVFRICILKQTRSLALQSCTTSVVYCIASADALVRVFSRYVLHSDVFRLLVLQEVVGFAACRSSRRDVERTQQRSQGYARTPKHFEFRG